MSCALARARAGDAFTLLIRYRTADGTPVPLNGLEARGEFRDSTSRVLLLLTEGAGLVTAGPDGDATIRVRATASETLALAPSAGQPSHEINLAVRVFDASDINGTTQTICDVTVIASELEVSLP